MTLWLSRHRVLFVQLLGIAGLGAGLLFVFSRLIDHSRLHLAGTLNDQVSYISAARRLVDTGSINSSLIYPSLLYQSFSKNHLYMPGYYYSLGIVYKFFRFGVLQSLLPSLLSFVLTTVCVFLIGKRLYGTSTGLVGSLLFALFPANLVYGFSAMAELSFLAAATIAVCILVYLPPRFRVYAGPFLAVLPFLFRETGALTVIPMAAIVLRDNPRKNLRRALGFGLAAAAVLGVIFTSDLARGRPSIITADIIDGSFQTVYEDAVKNQDASRASLSDWPPAIAQRLADNIETLLTPEKNQRYERLLNFAILAAIAACLGYGWHRRDLFALGAAGMAIATLVLLLTLYSVSDYRGLRTLLFTFPLLAVVLAAIYVREIAQWLKDRWPLGRRLSYAALAVFLLAELQIARGLHNQFSAGDAQEDRNQQFLESLGLDDTRVLVAPPDLSISYVAAHYPVQWSFIPYNRETLALLASRYEVGNVVLPTNNPGVELTGADLAVFGLSAWQVVQFNQQDYLIFRVSEK